MFGSLLLFLISFALLNNNDNDDEDDGTDQGDKHESQEGDDGAVEGGAASKGEVLLLSSRVRNLQTAAIGDGVELTQGELGAGLVVVEGAELDLADAGVEVGTGGHEETQGRG